MKTLTGTSDEVAQFNRRTGLRMRDLDFRKIPAVDRWITRGELASQVSVLEAELAKQQAAAVDLASQLMSMRALRTTIEARLFEVTAELKELQSTLVERDAALNASEEARAGVKAELETRLDEVTRELKELQSTLVERDAALNASEEARAGVKAELETRLAEVTRELKDLRSTLEERDAALGASEEARASMKAQLETRLAEAAQECNELQSTLVERDAALGASEEARAGTKAQLETRLSEAAQELNELQSTLDERDVALGALEEVRTGMKAQLETLRRQFEEMQSAQANIKTRDEEIATCRALANKCVFVVGFGRSYTTITLDILNCATNALILGEANFFLGDHGERFSAAYNKQHCEFQNQVTKSTNAPDFLPDVPHTWWQWLDSAAQFYDCVGEKIAFSDYHLSKAPPEAFRAFHEARFLKSRYIFMLRNPIDVLLSSAKLRGIVDDPSMTRMCAAWLDFMQLWADFVRVFPRTMTLVCERFGEATVKELETFTGLGLDDGQLLINRAKQQQHKLTGKFPTLLRLRPKLEELYRDALAAVDENRALWQAEQKRSVAVKGRKGDGMGSNAITSRPLGRVWLLAQELRDGLGAPPNQAGE